LSCADIDIMNHDIMKAILSTTDYTHLKCVHSMIIMNKHEELLATVLCCYFTKNKDSTPEQFKELFSMLRCELITPFILGRLAMTEQCKAVRRADHEFSNKLNDMFVFLATGFGSTGQVNRFTRTPSKTRDPVVTSFEQKVVPLELKDLKSGDKIDAKDYVGNWYTATVVDVHSDEGYVTVSYDGYGPEYNENIDESKHNSRLSVFKSVTNGIPHLTYHERNVNGRQCTCVTCLETPKTEKPETVKPETVKPETVKPETVKPETVKPETEKPEAEETDTIFPFLSSGKIVITDPQQVHDVLKMFIDLVK